MSTRAKPLELMRKDRRERRRLQIEVDALLVIEYFRPTGAQPIGVQLKPHGLLRGVKLNPFGLPPRDQEQFRLRDVYRVAISVDKVEIQPSCQCAPQFWATCSWLAL